MWIASAGIPAGDGARRPCLLAARVLPPSWGEWVAGGPVGEGLAPVNLAGGAGSHRLLCVLVAVALAVSAARIAAGILARLLRARRERRVVRAWAGSRGAPGRASGRAPECAPERASGEASECAPERASGEASGRASGEVPGRGGTSPRPRARFAALSRCAVLSRCASSTRRGEAAHHRGRAQGPPSTRELALLTAEVSTRLRAGAPASSAWERALERIGVGSAGGTDDVYPRALDEWAREPPRWRSLLMRARSPDAAAARASAASVVVACRFSHGLGAPLADVLDAIGDAIDDSQDVEEARRVASAGPLMSARVLAGLPLVGVTAALALGASPWGFYTSGTPGVVCASLGVLAWVAGVASCRRILARCRRADASGGDTDAALACDLIASALACGASIPRALDALADACAQEPLAWTASSLRLGATWEQAWEEAPAWADPLRDALEASWTAGT
ncbi:MAG: type II secretion system F family protein, partial [Pauljensenia sp.]